MTSSPRLIVKRALKSSNPALLAALLVVFLLLVATAGSFHIRPATEIVPGDSAPEIKHTATWHYSPYGGRNNVRSYRF